MHGQDYVLCAMCPTPQIPAPGCCLTSSRGPIILHCAHRSGMIPIPGVTADRTGSKLPHMLASCPLLTAAGCYPQSPHLVLVTSALNNVTNFKKDIFVIGIDLDESSGSGANSSKQRGVSDGTLAGRLRAELATLLATPLHQRINARFFAGGATQPAAAALAATNGDAAPAPVTDGTARNDVGDGEEAHTDAGDKSGEDVAGQQRRGVDDGATGMVPSAAMRQSVALAEGLVDARVKASASNRKAGSKAKLGTQGRNRGPASLAACQAAALQKAVDSKRRRKAGAGANAKVPTAVVTTRASGGLDALAALSQCG